MTTMKEAMKSKPLIDVLEEELSTKKRELSLLTPKLNKELGKARTVYDHGTQTAQSRAAKKIKPHVTQKAEATNKPRKAFAEAKACARREYQAAESEAAIERKEAIEAAHAIFENACEDARVRFNSRADVIHEEMKQDQAEVKETYEKETFKLSRAEVNTRNELVTDIQELEKKIEAEVKKTKKNEKKSKPESVEAQA